MRAGNATDVLPMTTITLSVSVEHWPIAGAFAISRRIGVGLCASACRSIGIPQD
jgi:hypothetical protein